jgi:hypothetical protein
MDQLPAPSSPWFNDLHGQTTFSMPSPLSRGANVTFNDHDGKPALTLNFDANPPTIDLHGNTPDEAARVFWNGASQLVGRQPMFPQKALEPPGEEAKP